MFFENIIVLKRKLIVFLIWLSNFNFNFRVLIMIVGMESNSLKFLVIVSGMLMFKVIIYLIFEGVRGFL